MPLFQTKKKLNRQELLQRLSSAQLTPQHQERLLSFLEQASDDELSRINPKALVAAFGLDQHEILSLFASGFQHGLFLLNWEVQCPACSGSACYFKGPGDSYHRITCVGCSNQFEAHFDEHVHITFRVHPSVRTLPPAPKLKTALPKVAATTHPPLTAHELLTVQAFRDFFKSETIPESESFEVSRLTLLFTDLTGSTAFYVRRGDPFAYSLVREHFAILRRVVDKAGGAIVKTIGDAVMAVFITEKAGIEAALEAQKQIEAFNEAHALPHQDLFMLKIGVHCGPSIYVSLDERLDYFGTTVNTAARIQNEAKGGEIVFSRQVLDAPGVRELLKGFSLRDEVLNLKGLDRPIELWRVQVS
ncbi:MAG TPA: adenylate/guanylate cyclase domain-containing protein [Chloroflexia bacterium]|nr:adenylate/guanylate cyclase domain-containing protein [Chloroflexia bacterium]